MSAKRSGYGVGLGFLAIGLGLFAWTLVLFMHMRSETEIGQRLVAEGVETDALLVTAEFIERLSCTGGTIKSCRPSDYAVGQIIYLVGDLRAVADISLSEDEFTAFGARQEVRIPIVHLPETPLELERERGSRLASAQNDVLNIYVLAAFAVTFTLIGGIATLVARHRARVPSTGPDS